LPEPDVADFSPIVDLVTSGSDCVEQSIETGKSVNGLVRNYPWLTVLTGMSVLLQAILAGRGWFMDYDLIEVHGFVGNVTFLLVILLVIGAWLGRQAGVMTNTELIVSIALIALTAAQFGLGYGGRDSRSAAALHIPNAILITGLTSALIAISFIRQPNRG
jgi:hypothetical protein